MKTLIQLILLFQILTIILTQEITLESCKSKNQCLINGATKQCGGSSTSISSYKVIESLFDENFKKYKLSNINQIQCGSVLEQCASIDPGDIDDECTNFDMKNDLACCYMKLKYKYNTKHACYPIAKNKKEIKDKIKKMKEYYIGIKGISIYCYENFVKINFYVLIFGFLILF